MSRPGIETPPILLHKSDGLTMKPAFLCGIRPRNGAAYRFDRGTIWLPGIGPTAENAVAAKTGPDARIRVYY